MKRGALVPDGVIIKLVETRLDSGRADDVYLFDGFPRTIAQAELLEKSLVRRGGAISNVFFLDAPREVLVERLTGRRTCRKCGANYHVRNIPPKKEGICDACGGELYQRPDDSEGTIVKRLEVYNRDTAGLIARYQKQGLLTRVNSAQDATSLAAEILGGIRKGA